MQLSQGRFIYSTPVRLVLIILAVFLVRTLLAAAGTNPPRLFDIFNVFILLASVVTVFIGFRRLTRADWLFTTIISVLIGVLLPFSTLYTPYGPLFGIRNPLVLGVARALSLGIVVLAGLLLRREGAPVRVIAVERGNPLKSVSIGLLVGLPFALLNVVALWMMNGQAIAWQNPLAAGLDALQPGVVEEAFYRLTFLGLLWLALRGQTHATLWAAVLALCVHNFAHLDDLLRDRPLFALGYGCVMALLWGLPPTLLALRRDFEAGTAFHWLQDALRFLCGF